MEKGTLDPLEEHKTWCPWIQLLDSSGETPVKTQENAANLGQGDIIVESSNKLVYPWVKVLSIVCPEAFDIHQGSEVTLPNQFLQVCVMHEILLLEF